MNYSIAIDLGASGGKMICAYFDGSKVNVLDEYRFNNIPVNFLDNLYWDIFGLYKEIIAGLTKFGKKFGQAESIGIDTWGASYGFLDIKGRLLEPVYHYRDDRTIGVLKEMYNIIPKKEVFDLTGCQCERSYTLPQLFATVKDKERSLELADKMLLLPDLLGYFFTGEISTERTIAGTSALLEASQEGFCRTLFDKLNIPTKILTEIVDAGSAKGVVIDSIAKKTGINKAKVISTVGHDSAAAVVGIPNFKKDDLYISIGTNVSMGTERNKPCINDEFYNYGFKNTGGLKRKIILYKDFAAFWIVNELKNEWKQKGKDYSYEDLIKLAINVKNNNSFISLEDENLNSVGNNMQEKIDNYLIRTRQNSLNSDGEYIRCIFESIALKIKYCKDNMEKSIGIKFNDTYVINGGSRNELLNQLIADVLDKPVKAGMPNATLIGNMLTQFYANGYLKDLEDIRFASSKSFDMKYFIPNSSKNWDEILDIAINKKIV
ncbi:rhamnulokinase [Vallitalea guaymasensis]|uniref:rhamnulokinase n=1 Tax=Vallitalea guaymasensis TaxID=1185412 RepID=UPI00272C89B7|nr:FGGY-family carbohydrate kinase [Vallitalea guaymasensis]